MTAYAKELGIPFVDLNTIEGKYAVDWKYDTRDGGKHLNCYGAKKVTKYLGKYITENYTFENKKDNRNMRIGIRNIKSTKKYMKKTKKSKKAGKVKKQQQRQQQKRQQQKKQRQNKRKLQKQQQIKKLQL